MAGKSYTECSPMNALTCQQSSIASLARAKIGSGCLAGCACPMGKMYDEVSYIIDIRLLQKTKKFSFSGILFFVSHNFCLKLLDLWKMNGMEGNFYLA